MLTLIAATTFSASAHGSTLGAAPTTEAGEAPAAESATPRAQVDVDTSGLGDDAVPVEELVREGITATLTQGNIEPTQDAEAPRVFVTVSPLGGDKPGYRCSYEIRDGNEIVDGTAGVSDCRLCTEGEVVEVAQAAVETLLPKLRQLAEAKDEPEPTPAEESTTTDPTEDGSTGAGVTTDGGGRGGLGPLGKTGIALAVVGGAALIPGVVLAVLPPKPLPDAERRNTRPPGIGLAVGGGALLVTGVALIVVDAARRKRSGSKQARVRVAPAWTQGHGSLVLQGRF